MGPIDVAIGDIVSNTDCHQGAAISMSERPVNLQRFVSIAMQGSLAIASVGIALAVTLLLQPTVFPTPLFFVAVVVSTWFGGVMSGLFAVLFATMLLGYFFVAPARGQSLTAQDLVYLKNQLDDSSSAETWTRDETGDADDLQVNSVEQVFALFASS